jgi:glycosyltransferase involved in cell wall biosynthesis
VVLDLATGLAKRGHTVWICTISPVNEFAEELRASEGLPIHFHSLLPDTKSRFLPNLPFLFLRLKRIIKEMKPDLLHCHLRTDAAVCSIVRSIPIVRTVHISRPIVSYRNVSLSFAPVNWLERRSLLLPNVRLVTCSQAAGHVLGRYLAFRGRSAPTVIENGTNLIRLKETQNNQYANNSYIIVITGTLINAHKNQQMGIRTLKILIDKNIDCQLWLLGDGEDRTNLENLATQLDIRHRVTFFGEVNNVEDYLARASVCWVTSKFEGMPIVLLEAMAAGLPVIATAAAGVKEVLEEWPELLVQVDDYMGMAEITAKLLEQPEQMKKIGAALRKRAFEKYSADRMVEDYIQFYHKCLSA